MAAHEAQAPLNDRRDFEWQALEDQVRATDKRATCVPVLATDPLYILYTSGTTGIQGLCAIMAAFGGADLGDGEYF